MPSKKHNQVPQDQALLGCEVINLTKPRRQTKKSLILELVSRVGGVTLEEITSATGWLPHTARAAITGVRKRGHDVQCKRVDGVSRYTTTSNGK